MKVKADIFPSMNNMQVLLEMSPSVQVSAIIEDTDLDVSVFIENIAHVNIWILPSIDYDWDKYLMDIDGIYILTSDGYYILTL